MLATTFGSVSSVGIVSAVPGGGSKKPKTAMLMDIGRGGDKKSTVELAKIKEKKYKITTDRNGNVYVDPTDASVEKFTVTDNMLNEAEKQVENGGKIYTYRKFEKVDLSGLKRWKGGIEWGLLGRWCVFSKIAEQEEFTEEKKKEKAKPAIERENRARQKAKKDEEKKQKSSIEKLIKRVNNKLKDDFGDFITEVRKKTNEAERSMTGGCKLKALSERLESIKELAKTELNAIIENARDRVKEELTSEMEKIFKSAGSEKVEKKVEEAIEEVEVFKNLKTEVENSLSKVDAIVRRKKSEAEREGEKNKRSIEIQEELERQAVKNFLAESDESGVKVKEVNAKLDLEEFLLKDKFLVKDPDLAEKLRDCHEKINRIFSNGGLKIKVKREGSSKEKEYSLNLCSAEHIALGNWAILNKSGELPSHVKVFIQIAGCISGGHTPLAHSMLKSNSTFDKIVKKHAEGYLFKLFSGVTDLTEEKFKKLLKYAKEVLENGEEVPEKETKNTKAYDYKISGLSFSVRVAVNKTSGEIVSIFPVEP